MSPHDRQDQAAPSIQTPESKPELTSSGGGPLKPGQVVAGKYEIIEPVGSGGMSTVYCARHLLTKQTVALKILSQAIASNPQYVSRFQHEAKAVSKLSHPNIVRMYDFDIADGMPFLTMDFLKGKPLSDLIKEKGGLAPDGVVPIFVQLCQALAHAHTEGILHRDLKPSNVIVTEQHGTERPIVVDFGIAKIASDETQGLTRTGEIFGSPYYMSPEQCDGLKLDARSDIYSLGCMLFEALTGQPPFQGGTVYATIRMHLEQSPPALRSIKQSLKGRLADELQSIVIKALQKDPKHRFQSMDEFCSALQASQTKSELSTFLGKISTLPRPARKPLVLFNLLCFAALLLVFIITCWIAPSLWEPVIGELRGWFINVEEAIYSPAGSPMDRWRIDMLRGMRHMNNSEYQRAEKYLQTAQNTAREAMLDKQQGRALKQLQILYHLENAADKESAMVAQLNAMRKKFASHYEEEVSMFQQMIDLTPVHPDATQVTQMHTLIKKGIELAVAATNDSSLKDALKVLAPLNERAQAVLPSNDPVLLNLRVFLCWENSDAAEAESLLANQALNEKQHALMTYVKTINNYRSNPAQATSTMKQVVAVLSKSGQSRSLATAWLWLGYLETINDHPNDAAVAYTQAMKSFRAIGDIQHYSRSVTSVADELIALGKPADAISILHQQLDQLDKSLPSDQELAAECYDLLAASDRALGKVTLEDTDNALRLTQVSYDPIDSPAYRLILRHSIDNYWETRKFQTVLGLSRQLVAISEIGRPFDERLHSEQTDLMGAANFALGHNQEARAIFAKRFTQFIATQPATAPKCNEWFVDLCTRCATASEAKQVTAKLSDSIDQMVSQSKSPESIIDTMRWLARVYWQLNNHPQAMSTYRQAETFLTTHKVSARAQYSLLFDYAFCLKSMGDPEAGARIEAQAKSALAGKPVR